MCVCEVKERVSYKWTHHGGAGCSPGPPTCRMASLVMSTSSYNGIPGGLWAAVVAVVVVFIMEVA